MHRQVQQHLFPGFSAVTGPYCSRRPCCRSWRFFGSGLYQLALSESRTGPGKKMYPASSFVIYNVCLWHVVAECCRERAGLRGSPGLPGHWPVLQLMCGTQRGAHSVRFGVRPCYGVSGTQGVSRLFPGSVRSSFPTEGEPSLTQDPLCAPSQSQGGSRGDGSAHQQGAGPHPSHPGPPQGPAPTWDAAQTFLDE